MTLKFNHSHIFLSAVILSFIIHFIGYLGVARLNSFQKVTQPEAIAIQVNTLPIPAPVPTIISTPKPTPVPEKIQPKPPETRKPRIREDARPEVKQEPVQTEELEIRGGLSESTSLSSSGQGAPVIALGNSSEVAVDATRADLPTPPVVVKERPASQVPIAEAAVERMAQCRSSREIEITDEAANAGITSGEIQVEYIVNDDGTIGDVIIKRGLGYGLDERAIQAVKSFRCQPAQKSGTNQAVKKIHRFKIQF